jgi:hypothetical protein
MFRATNSLILRGTFDCTYSFWYNAPTLLPTGDTVEMELTDSRFHLKCTYSFWYNAATLLPTGDVVEMELTDSRFHLKCTYSCWYNAPTMLPTGDVVEMEVPSQPRYRSAAVSVHCTKSFIYSHKCSLGWTNLSPETCRADLKRSVKGICCILLVAYIIVLV